MFQIKYDQDIKAEYYSLIKCHAYEKIEKEYVKSWEKKLGYTLEELLCSDFQKLVEIKEDLGTKYKDSKALKQLFNYDKQKSKTYHPIASKLQPKIANFMEENLDIHTCYFCNIDFINAFKSTTKGSKNGFTLDHFINKAKYPFLALSLYNLIPSCYICNSKLKRSETLWDINGDIEKVSPSSNKFKFDEKVKFKSFLSGNVLNINSKKDFDIFLKEEGSNDYDKYIDILRLDERYAYHKRHVLEMIKKREIYPDSRIEELAQLTKQTTEKVKQDLFGTSLYDDDLSTRSLSKFTKDIARELGLI